MAEELGADYPFLCLPGRNPQGHLHDQCSGVAEHESAENHQNARVVPERRSGSEVTLAGPAESLEEMEFAAGLEGSAQPVSDSVAGENAGAGTELRK